MVGEEDALMKTTIEIEVEADIVTAEVTVGVAVKVNVL